MGMRGLNADEWNRAPVFSAIGFAARVQTSKSKDLTYNNPLLLLWA